MLKILKKLSKELSVAQASGEREKEIELLNEYPSIAKHPILQEHSVEFEQLLSQLNSKREEINWALLQQSITINPYLKMVSLSISDSS